MLNANNLHLGYKNDIFVPTYIIFIKKSKIMRLFVLLLLTSIFLFFGTKVTAQGVAYSNDSLCSDSTIAIANDSITVCEVKEVRDTCENTEVGCSLHEQPNCDSIVSSDTCSSTTLSIQFVVEGFNQKPVFPFSVNLEMKNGLGIEFKSIPKINLAGLALSMPIKSLPVTPGIGIANIRGEGITPIVSMTFSRENSLMEMQAWCVYAPASFYKVHAGLAEITFPVKSFNTGIFTEWCGFLSPLKNEQKAPLESELIFGPVIERSFGRKGNFALALHGGLNLLDMNEYELSTHLGYTFKKTKKITKRQEIDYAPTLPVDTAKNILPAIARQSDTSCIEQKALQESRNTNLGVAHTIEDSSSNIYASVAMLKADLNNEAFTVTEVDKKNININDSLTVSSLDSFQKRTGMNEDTLTKYVSMRFDPQQQQNVAKELIATNSNSQIYGINTVFNINPTENPCRNPKSTSRERDSSLRGMPYEIVLLALFVLLRKKRNNSS